MKHTFQQGDRVKSDIHDSAVGYIVRQQMAAASGRDGWLIKRDDGVRSDDFGELWWVAECNLSHDTELRKGDWVRYEKTDEVGTEKWNGKTGIITVVDWYGAYPTASVDGIENGILQANLVKIQPPQADDNDCIIHTFTSYTQEEPMQERQEDAIELGIQEKIRLLERQVEKAKCCLETYRDLKVFLNQGESHGTR